MTAQLACDAPADGAVARKGPGTLSFTRTVGQYCSADYQAQLKRHNLRGSMSARLLLRHCLRGSFFHSLKVDICMDTLSPGNNAGNGV